MKRLLQTSAAIVLLAGAASFAVLSSATAKPKKPADPRDACIDQSVDVYNQCVAAGNSVDLCKRRQFGYLARCYKAAGIQGGPNGIVNAYPPTNVSGGIGSATPSPINGKPGPHPSLAPVKGTPSPTSTPRASTRGKHNQ